MRNPLDGLKFGVHHPKIAASMEQHRQMYIRASKKLAEAERYVPLVEQFEREFPNLVSTWFPSQDGEINISTAKIQSGSTVVEMLRWFRDQDWRSVRHHDSSYGGLRMYWLQPRSEENRSKTPICLMANFEVGGSEADAENCRYVKVGEKIEARPIYELQCGGDVVPTGTEPEAVTS